jgi:hypothetical protein
MTHRRGFALAVALMAIVLIAVVVTASLFAASQETRAGDAALLDQKVAAYAELASLDAMGSWNAPACDALAVGAVIILTPPADPPFESTVYITRLDSALFLIVGEGRIAIGTAIRLRRRVAITVKTTRDVLGQTRATRVSEQAWSALYQM